VLYADAVRKRVRLDLVKARLLLKPVLAVHASHVKQRRRSNPMAKELSPKQKQIAKVAGNPNKIEGKDFQALKSMKKGSGVKGKTQKQLPRKKGM
jgi:hypothetical protein